ncbi:MAG: Imm8 family immunity protein [Arenicella sp.]
MKIEIKYAHISSGDQETNIRIWNPEKPDCFAGYLVLEIGEKGKKGGSDFCCRIATPKGLEQLYIEDENSTIIYSRPILIVREYSYQDIWECIQKIIEDCQGVTWNESRDKLLRYFEWEFEDYNQM